MPAGPHGLRPPAHGDAIRQGTHVLPAEPASPGVIRHGAFVDPRGTGGGHGAGGLAGDPPPVHAADPQARDLPRAAAGPGAAEAVSQADADQELATAAGP